jgi:hypothetical protein
MVWRPVAGRRKHREYPWTLGSMQVYASYRYRRDLVEAVKSPGALTRTRPLMVCRAAAHCCCDAGTRRGMAVQRGRCGVTGAGACAALG